ncbi:hypothetical protein POUND7_020762 [Theobroma cacao]
MDSRGDRDRIPLAQVVSELVKGWFQDAMKEARAGDTNMQVLVGQMYCTGFGVPKDVQKLLLLYFLVVSRIYDTLCELENPDCYDASDSDSEELKRDAK